MEGHPFPLWLAIPLAVIIMAAFWSLFFLPLIWAPLAIIPVGLLIVAAVRSWRFHTRR